MPARTNLKAWKGNPFTQEFRFKDGSGIPIDLSGRLVTFFLAWPGGELVKSTLLGGFTISDQSDPEFIGIATLSMTKSEIFALPLGQASNYEIELDDETWLYGSLIVEQWARNND